VPIYSRISKGNNHRFSEIEIRFFGFIGVQIEQAEWAVDFSFFF